MSTRNILFFIVLLTLFIVVAITNSGTNFFSSSSTTTTNEPTTTRDNSDNKNINIKVQGESTEQQQKQKIIRNTENKITNHQEEKEYPSSSLFSPSFLKSNDAAGQIWQFFSNPHQEEEKIYNRRPKNKQKSFSEILQEYQTCQGTGNVFGIPNKTEVQIASETTPFWNDPSSSSSSFNNNNENIINKICKKRGTKPISNPDEIPVLVYGALFGFEVDILEIVFHEALPIVDALVVVESTTTHALHSKPLVFEKLLQSRLRRFQKFVAPSSSVNSYTAPLLEKEKKEKRNEKDSSSSSSSSWYGKDENVKIFPRVFSPRRSEKSGWTVEKKQRREFQRSLPYVFQHLAKLFENKKLNQRTTSSSSSSSSSPPVIVISQLDLDEIPTRETLLYWKYCENPDLPLRVAWFRYTVECQQEEHHSRFSGTIWRMKSLQNYKKYLDPTLDLYARRRWVSKVKKTEKFNRNETIPDELCDSILKSDNVAWHFSAFGGVTNVLRKNSHSPHAFVRRERQDRIADEIRDCVFGKKQRWKLPAKWWACRSRSSGKRNVDEISSDDIYQRTTIMPVALPHFVAENICMFTRLGWLS